MKSEKPLVEIKGFGGTLGLLIDQAVAFDQIEDELIRLLQRSNSKHFFQGAEIFLQGNGGQLTSEEFARLEKLLKREGDLQLKTEPPEALALPPEGNPSPDLLQTESPSSEEYLNTAWFSTTASPETEASQNFSERALSDSHSLDSSGIKTMILEEASSSEKSAPLLASSFLTRGLKTADALLVRQTLHSGQNIRSKSSVILMGDLNAGAEIVSDQDVIVLGSIRGMVHAGASGNRKALIFALRMQPTQIRIAELITQPPAEDKKKRQLEPEIAFIEGDSMIIETCRKIRV